MKPAERRRLAAGRQLTAEQVEQLATDPTIMVRRRLAQRHDLPAEVFKQLALDPSEAVRAEIASNAYCPASVLVQLLADEQVAHLAACEGARHPEVAAAAMAHPRVQIREWFALGLGPGSPHLVAMAGDPDDEVRAAVAIRVSDPGTIDVLTDDTVPAVVQTLAGNDHLSQAQVERLSRSSWRLVRRAVAVRSDLPGEVVARLAQDRSADVRWHLLSHQPGRELLEGLVDDPDQDVRDTARMMLAGLDTGDPSPPIGS